MDFLKSNGGKIAVLVVILVVAGFLTFRSGGGSLKDALSDKLLYVDVTTGKIISFDHGGTVVLPRTNPKTGERTLVPVEDRDGVYYVVQRRSVVLEQLAKQNKWVDTQTLRVRDKGE